MRPELITGKEAADTLFARSLAAVQARSDMPDLLVPRDARVLFEPKEPFATREYMPLPVGRRAMHVVHISDHGRAEEVLRQSTGRPYSQVYEPGPVRFARRHFGVGHPNNGGPWGFDRPELDDIRKLISEPFKPQTLGALEGQIQTDCESAMENLLRQDGEVFDIGEYANRVLFRMMSRLMGVDERLSLDFRNWMRGFNESKSLAALNRQPEIRRKLGSLLTKAETSRSRGQEVPGLIGHLAARYLEGGKIGGRSRLTRSDVVSLLWSVIAAGTDTPATAAAAGVYFALQKDVFAQLAGLDAAERGVLEANRLYPPFPNPLVKVSADHILQGVELRKGDWVRVHLPAVNRDRSVFNNPDAYDLERIDGMQARTFGSGPHHCIGQIYGVRVGAHVVSTLARRMPNMSLPKELPKRHIGLLHRLENMSVCTKL